MDINYSIPVRVQDVLCKWRLLMWCVRPCCCKDEPDSCGGQEIRVFRVLVPLSHGEKFREKQFPRVAGMCWSSRKDTYRLLHQIVFYRIET